MAKKVYTALFTLWILLIPLPLFYPLVTLDYTPYYDQFSSLSFYPHFIVAIPIVFIGWRTLKGPNLEPPTLLWPLGLTIPLCLLVLLTAISTSYAQRFPLSLCQHLAQPLELST